MKALFKFPISLLFLFIIVFVTACGAPASTATPIAADYIPVAEMSDMGGAATEEAALPVTGQDSQPPAAEPPAAEPPTASENAPTELPAKNSSHAGDYDSSETAAAKRAAGGDRFSFGRFERPFNANSMDVYFPYLDIVDSTAFQDEKFIYGVMALKETTDDGKLPGSYAFEIDLNLDGRGDWLILVKAPASSAWSTQGVQVWNDADQDVGGIVSVNADTKLASGNGYERLVADGGKGESPEAGWVRIDPSSPNTIQFAISSGLLGSDKTYMAGMWAGTTLTAAQFDFNDYMTHEQAGAADPGLANFYPIKALAELDNTCRMAIGFQPTGDEPGLCPEAAPLRTVVPTPTKKPTGCQVDPAIIRRCKADASYTWNEKTCECDYTGPR